jgi:hypothetical protein
MDQCAQAKPRGRLLQQFGLSLRRRIGRQQPDALFARLGSERTKIPKPGGKGGHMILMGVGC